MLTRRMVSGGGPMPARCRRRKAAPWPLRGHQQPPQEAPSCAVAGQRPVPWSSGLRRAVSTRVVGKRVLSSVWGERLCFTECLVWHKKIGDRSQGREASHAVCIMRAGNDNSNDAVEEGRDLDNDNKTLGAGRAAGRHRQRACPQSGQSAGVLVSGVGWK
jgi:hypothetical protein